MLDIEGLRKLKADLPLKLKVWTKRCKGKVVLQTKLGDFLDHLDSCSIPATFKITPSGDSLTCVHPVQKQEARKQQTEQVQELQAKLPVTVDTAPVVTETPSAAEAMLFIADVGLVFENEVATRISTSVSDGKCVTFVNLSTGATFSLPTHTQA